jgi:hypothetical protein
MIICAPVQNVETLHFNNNVYCGCSVDFEFYCQVVPLHVFHTSAAAAQDDISIPSSKCTNQNNSQDFGNRDVPRVYPRLWHLL